MARVRFCKVTLIILISFISPINAAKKAIVIGATSGIGEAVAKELARHDYEVGLVGRRENLLKKHQEDIATKTYIKVIDVTQTEEAREKLQELIKEMGGLDLVVVNAGVGGHGLDWENQESIVDVNVKGFLAMASIATDYFLKQDHGHIVGISSIAALRGGAFSPAYSASKAFVSNYLEGLRYYFNIRGNKITVTDIKPGFVKTDMIGGVPGVFWEATSEEAALQIYEAIENKSEHAYITKRWRIIAWFFKLLPDFVWERIMKRHGEKVWEK